MENTILIILLQYIKFEPRQVNTPKIQTYQLEVSRPTEVSTLQKSNMHFVPDTVSCILAYT